jgi:hypothetical protein
LPSINHVPNRRPARAAIALVDPHVAIDDPVVVDPRRDGGGKAARQPLRAVPNPSHARSGELLADSGTGGEVKHA